MTTDNLYYINVLLDPGRHEKIVHLSEKDARTYGRRLGYQPYEFEVLPVHASEEEFVAEEIRKAA
jgi:hypothetical protein